MTKKRIGLLQDIFVSGNFYWQSHTKADIFPFAEFI